MNRTCLALPALLALVGFAPRVGAQQETEDGRVTVTNGQVGGVAGRDERRDERRDEARFGDAGQVAISAERMFGAGFVWESAEVNGEDLDTTTFNVSVLSDPLANLANTYSFPRIGIDYFVTDNVSIGAALGFAHSSFDEDDELQAFDSITAFLAAPRVGYAYMFNDYIGIWPRVGVTWINISASAPDDTELSSSRFALTGEIPFVIQPTDNVAFLLGPTFDLGLAGSDTLEGTNGEIETDVTATELGIQVGLLAFF